MSNSNLVSYTLLSPNCNAPRKHAIDTITIHCMAGNLSLLSLGKYFAKSETQASSNYGIDSNGRIGLFVEETNRSWCSSNADNDNRAVTIEVANDGDASTGWHVSEAAINSLVILCADICKRNGIKKLLWQADKTLIGQVDKQNMTVHKWFKNKDCPGAYLYNMHFKIAEEVNKILAAEENKNAMYYPKYTGASSSLTDALNTLKIDSSKAHRQQIAWANGINDYCMTAAQNSRLLALLKMGKLIIEN